MMHKSKTKFKNFNKTCCLLTSEGLAVASSDPIESSLTNNASSACSSGMLMGQQCEEITNFAFRHVKIKTSLVKISDDRKVDVIPLLRAIEKGAFILWLRWDPD